MSAYVRLRRWLGRVLPPTLKSFLRRILPVGLVAWTPSTRRVVLLIPTPPAQLGPAVRTAAVPPRVSMDAPWRSYVPRLLEADGVGGYEPETMAAFLAAISFLAPSDVFDIGANVGIFSIVAAATTTAHVTGFEPTPVLAETFRAVVDRNGLACTVEPIALGSTTGRATLFLSARSDSSNSLREGFRRATGTVDVPVERLDDYVRRSRRHPRVLKVDTETTEPDVLAGSIETLRADRPWIICEVLAGKTEAPLAALLRPLGYRFHRLGLAEPPVEADEIVGDVTYRLRDWLFTPDPLPRAFGDHYRTWLATLSGSRAQPA